MPARVPGNLRLLARPSMFLLHVPAVLAVVATYLLGQWQLGAWQEHRKDRAAELADARPRALGDVLGADDAFPADGVGRPVRMTGTWQPRSTVFVEDRTRPGARGDRRDGVWVVTLLTTCGSERTDCSAPAAIPVVRGWAPSPSSAPRSPTGEADVTGWLQPSESDDQPDPDPGDDVLPSLVVTDLLQRVDQDLYGGYVILRSPVEARAALAPVTPDSLPGAPTFTALRNFLYAVEWWLFGIFAVYLWWRWTQDELASARARGDDVSPVSEDAVDGGDPTAARIPSEP